MMIFGLATSVLYGKSIISHFINGRFKLYWTGMNIIIGRMTEAEDFEYRIQFYQIKGIKD